MIGKIIKYLVLVLSFFTLFPSSAMAAVSDWQKGATIYPQYNTDFSSDSFKQSVKNLSGTNANYVTLVIPYYQSSTSSIDIQRGWNTPTDESLISGINYIHSLGMKVNLKVHIDPYSGEWRRFINPYDRDAWFKNYTNVLTHYSTIAKNTNSEQMTLGSEIYELTSPNANSSNTNYWNSMISEIRKNFSGTITYSAQHTTPTEENEIQFWNNMDYIGIAGYFPLDTGNNNPTVESIKNSWQQWDNQIISPLYQKWNKPILFTELGYKSVQGAHFEPAAWWRSGPADETEQARDYEALFSYWNDKPYLAGVHIWEWESNPNAGGSGNTSYTPQNKQAQAVITDWFSNNTNSSPTPSAPPPNNSSNYTTKSVTASTNLKPGSPISIASTVTPDSNVGDIIVDIEIYDSSNGRVYQQYFEHQNINSNQTQTFNINWTPNREGIYRVKIGIFSNNWGANYHWNDNSLAINISDNSTTPTPILTVTPTITPQPTNTPSPINTPTPEPTNNPTTPPQETLNGDIQVWWPTNGVSVSGGQPLKALLNNASLSSYKMYWQVDGDRLNEMSDNFTDYPHKEVWVDLNGWNWKGNGPYNLNFIVKDLNGNTIKETLININVNH